VKNGWNNMTTKLQTKETVLDSSISLRSAQWADINAVTQLIYDVCEADGDTTVAVTAEEMKVEWQTPGFNLETDAIVAVTADGRIVGFEEFMDEHEHSKLRTDGYVHPRFKGLGIATAMMQAIEERARKDISLAAPGVRVYLHSTLDSHDKDGRSVHENCGFSPIRYHWRMQADLKSPPPVAVWPAGIELRPFIKGEHDRVVWEAMNEAFRDHWGHHDIPFDQWELGKFGSENFDPSLWMVAWEGDQIAGISLNRYRMDIGWISNLGVRRPWRKMGLGYSLLIHSFGEFYKRGTKTIGLGVDAENPTGATRLYIKAGMYAASEFVTYEKELRPGRELDEHE
jgi:mycothiol synthase